MHACKVGVEGISYHLHENLFQFYVGPLVILYNFELGEDSLSEVRISC